MFTVKHVTPNGDALWEVDTVNLDRNAGSSASNSQIGTLFLHMPDGTTGSIDAGKAYVMNRDGKTVASYDFEAN